MPPAKDQILAAVRARRLAPAALPDLQQSWIRYEDRARQFAETIESVGGSCQTVAATAGVARALAEVPAFATAKKVLSLVPGVSANVDLATIDDPHALADLDFAVLPGVFGVAENGAIWVTDEGLRHRAAYFIPQHLALVIPAAEIVDNMHQAYERLAFGPARFGVFISGPSKTADIEQALVIGAHGPRSLNVFCVQ